MNSGSPQPTTSIAAVKLREPCDVLTYFYEGQMVYTEVAASHDEAVDKALAIFPALKAVPREQITFSVRAKVSTAPGGGATLVRIAPSADAWPRVVRGLVRFEVIEIHLLNTDPAPPSYAKEYSTPMAEVKTMDKTALGDTAIVFRLGSSKPHFFIRLRDAFRG